MTKRLLEDDLKLLIIDVLHSVRSTSIQTYLTKTDRTKLSLKLLKERGFQKNSMFRKFFEISNLAIHFWDIMIEN